MSAPISTSRFGNGLLAAAAILALSASAHADSFPAATPQAILDSSTEIRAQLSPVRSTVLSSEVPGRIAELTVREGERFTAGQRLVGIDCSVHKARLDKAKAQLQAARKTHQVNSRLDKLNSISALEVDASAAQLAAAEADVNMMRIMVDRCDIAAPYPGRVVELKVRRDQYVSEGKELMEILDDRNLEVEANVPSRWLPWLKPGTPFTVRIEETGKTVAAKVARLAARIDPVSQSIKVFGAITDPTPDLIAGMSGTAVFTPPN